ncbi:MAG TPA: RodZ domain-containing protein, partial [Thermaerobacter sp.]
ATKIRLKYLKAIEEGDERHLPPEVYTKGFIRAYANFLHLDGQELARAYGAWKEGRESEGPVADEPESGDEPAGAGGGATVGEEPAAGAGPAARPEAGDSATAADASLPPGPPLIPPLPGGRHRRRTGARMAPGYGMPRRRAGRWSRLAVLGLVLVAAVAVALYYAGGPDSAAERGPGDAAVDGGPAGTGTGPAPGGAVPAPGVTAPGADGTETPGEQPPPPEPEPHVLVERAGDEVRYQVRVAGAGPVPGEDVPVVLDATDDVWVRARDENGRVVFEKLMRSGDREELQLTGELRIRVGFPRGLRLLIAGQEVDVPDEESPLDLIVRRTGP